MEAQAEAGFQHPLASHCICLRGSHVDRGFGTAPSCVPGLSVFLTDGQKS